MRAKPASRVRIPPAPPVRPSPSPWRAFFCPATWGCMRAHRPQQHPRHGYPQDLYLGETKWHWQRRSASARERYLPNKFARPQAAASAASPTAPSRRGCCSPPRHQRHPEFTAKRSRAIRPPSAKVVDPSCRLTCGRLPALPDQPCVGNTVTRNTIPKSECCSIWLCMM